MREFENIVTETIYEVIRNVFESDIAEVIFQYLDESRSKDLDTRLRFFAESLPKIMGEGSSIIEDLILETVYFKCGRELEWKADHRFVDYLLELRERIEKRVV